MITLNNLYCTDAPSRLEADSEDFLLGDRRQELFYLPEKFLPYFIDGQVDAKGRLWEVINTREYMPIAIRQRCRGLRPRYKGVHFLFGLWPKDWPPEARTKVSIYLYNDGARPDPGAQGELLGLFLAGKNLDEWFERYPVGTWVKRPLGEYPSWDEWNTFCATVQKAVKT